MSRSFLYSWLASLLVVACYIRMDGANAYYYHYDELMHINIASGANLSQVLHFSLFETHPPILYIFLHYWLKLSSEIGFVRSLSLVFGLGTIIVYYQIGKQAHALLGGVCCAVLAAFSYGFIIQSYTVRHYAIFLFFLSLALYFYLQWQQLRRPWQLFIYCLCAVLACLTHFSGIFAIFTIAAHQSVYLLLKEKEKRALLKWALCNLTIALIYGYFYYLWRKSNAPFAFAALQEAYNATGTLSPSDLGITALFYPFLVVGYIFPAHFSVFFAILLLSVEWRDKKAAPPLTKLLLTALVTGMLLVASGSYQFTASRRSLWIAPFVLAATGSALSHCLLRIQRALPAFYAARFGYYAALGLTALGMLGYDKNARFNETGMNPSLSEYNKISKQELDKIGDYLGKLDKRYSVILGRDKIFLFAKENPYAYMDNASFERGSFAIMPYGNTNLVFATSYYNSPILAEGALQAQLKSQEKLVFIKLPFADEAMNKIAKCLGLQQEIIPFKTAELLIFLKKDINEQLLDKNGKYHHCM